MTASRCVRLVRPRCLRRHLGRRRGPLSTPRGAPGSGVDRRRRRPDLSRGHVRLEAAGTIRKKERTMARYDLSHITDLETLATRDALECEVGHLIQSSAKVQARVEHMTFETG